MTEKSSYGQILKASSITGGAAGITLLLGMVRVKFAAVLIGSAGVGLSASFSSIQNLAGTVAGLGIQSSAVRDVAAAAGQNDAEAVGRAVVTVRRVCWLTGAAGMAILGLLSPVISRLTFGSDAYTMDIAALGLVILLANLSGGQMAILQGVRRIGDMAHANVLGAAGATIVAVGFYLRLGLRGIVPALVAVAAVQLLLSWWFARRVPVLPVVLTWRQTFQEARGMVKLGLVLMWNAVLVNVVSFATITFITAKYGIDGVGFYSAAFALSGVFVNFVLGAMGSDYYPRLTAVAADRVAVNRLVNEQTEVGLLLAVPGLLATMSMAPWILPLFYSDAFVPAVALLQWFTLGCLGRVVSWPLGFVMMALGKGRWYLLTETGANLLHLALIVVGSIAFGLAGVAVAFALLYVVYAVAVLAVARQLTGFRWSSETRRIVLGAVAAALGSFGASAVLSFWSATVFSGLIVAVASVVCLRMLFARVGSQSSLVERIRSLPGARVVLGL